MADHFVLTRDQVRRVDEYAIANWGLTGLVLMENAGRGCTDLLEQLGMAGPIIILCGQGNNAGDGFVIARHLAVRGCPVTTILCGSPARLRGDAAANFQILQLLQLPWLELSEATEPQILAALQAADWIVDALLGTGASGPPRPPLDRVIDWANSQHCRRLAVDLPSGLDCDTGLAAQATFRAHHTATFVAAKPGLLLQAASEYVGELHVLDIGLPMSAIAREILAEC